MKNAEGDEDKEQLAKDLAPKQRQLFNVINLKDPDQKIQLWDISYHLFGKILDARLRNSDEEDNWDQFFFLEDGLMLKVGFAEKTYAGHSFFETETIDFKPRKEDYDEEMLEKVVCLDEILVPVGYNELKKILLQVDEEDEEDDKPKTKNRYNSVKDEDEEESSKKKKRVEPEDEDDEDDEPQKEFKFKKKSKSTEDEDGDADEDEEEEKPRVKAGIPDDEDEDEEEPAPKKKSAAPEGKKKLADDDDWDDFDEEEEEEETTPKKKTKK